MKSKFSELVAFCCKGGNCGKRKKTCTHFGYIKIKRGEHFHHKPACSLSGKPVTDQDKAKADCPSLAKAYPLPAPLSLPKPKKKKSATPKEKEKPFYTVCCLGKKCKHITYKEIIQKGCCTSIPACIKTGTAITSFGEAQQICRYAQTHWPRTKLAAPEQKST